MPIARFQMPDGRIARFEVPEGLSPQQAEQLIAESFTSDQLLAPSPEPETPGVLSQVLRAPLGIAKGFVGGLTTDPVSGLSSTLYSGAQAAGADLQPFEQTGFGEFLGEAQEALAPSDAGHITQLSHGVGSFLSFIPGGLLKGGAKILALGAQAMGLGAEEARSRVEMARLEGKDVNPEQQFVSQLTALGIGVTELAPAQKMFNTIKDVMRGVPKNKLDEFAPNFLNTTKRILETAGFEAAQEAAANVLQDLVQKGVYDPDLQIGESAFENAVLGGEVGAIAQGMVELVTRGKRRQMYEKLRAEDREQRLQEELATLEREDAEKMQETRTRLGVPETEPLALPAPAPKVEAVEEVDPLMNPLGSFNESELTPEYVRGLNKTRKEEGKTPLKELSIEDIADSGVEQAEIDRLLAARTGFDGSVEVSPQDILNLAQQKNISTANEGFSDFLRRTTGSYDLNSMSQPQLFSAFKALDLVPQSDTVQNLPQGTNATRFTEKQYDKSLSILKSLFPETNLLGRSSVLKELQNYSGLENMRDVESLLQTAIRRGDLETVSRPRYDVVDANGKTLRTYMKRESAERSAQKNGLFVQESTSINIAFPGEAGALPGGPDIRKGTFQEGTAPATFEIRSPDAVLSTAKNPDEADAKAERLAALRQKKAEGFLGQAQKLQGQIEKSRQKLESMEADGKADTVEYKKMAAGIDANNKKLQNQIDELRAKAQNYTQPLIINPKGEKPVTRDGYTLFDGDTPVATFNDRQGAEQAAVSRMSDEALQKTIDEAPTAKGLMPKRLASMAREEQARRAGTAPKGIGVTFTGERAEAEARLAEAGVFTGEFQARAKELSERLRPILDRLGLKDLRLNIERAIMSPMGEANGAYARDLISISMRAENPIQTLRHESIHALKELGAFTPQQWKVLEQRAIKEWMDKYDIERRYGALDRESQIEEAIADAFSEFDQTRPPSGMIAALHRKLKTFFEALGNAIRGMGFQTADTIFTSVEAGRVTPRRGAQPTGPIRYQTTGKYENTADFTPMSVESARIYQKELEALIKRSGDRIVGMKSEQTLDDVRKAVKKLQSYTAQGLKGREWYENSAQAVLDAFNGDPVLAEKFFQIIAITSANTEVASNFTKTANAWSQFARGKPIKAGTSAENRKISALLNFGEDWEGRKTNTFYTNLMEAMEGKDTGRSTIDLHISRMLFDKDAPTEAQYVLAENMIRLLASKTGLPARQIQAASWVTQKAKSMFDEYRAKGWKKKLNDEQLRELTWERALVDYAHLMKAKVRDLPVTDALRELSSSIRARTQTITGEVIPSVLTDMDQVEEIAFKAKEKLTKAIANAKIVEKMAKDLGITSQIRVTVGSGAYQSKVNPNLTVQVINDDSNIAKEDALLLARGMSYVFKQDATPFFRADPALVETGQLGYRFKFDRKELTPTQQKKIHALFMNRFGEDVGFSKVRPNEIVIINYRDENGQPMMTTDEDFAAGLGELLDQINKITPISSQTVFGAESEYNYHDWQQDPTGDSIVERIRSSKPGRPDLQQRLNNYRRSFIGRARDAVSGTGRDPRFSLRSDQLAVRPSDSSDGVSFGPRQPGAISVSGVHYGKEKTDVLSASKYGTGIRGAEARRVMDSEDERIRRRVYFYIPRENDTMPRPESGLGQHVYVQHFNNILGPGPELNRINEEVNFDPNAFESAVIDAGYDGYAVPRYGMMVVLNHDVPVNYRGTRQDVANRPVEDSVQIGDRRYSLRQTNTKEFKDWFGDSKIVDESGKPLVVYHGTNADFSEFDPSRLGAATSARTSALGFFSTDNKFVANRFADDLDGANVMPIYVSIKNPVELGYMTAQERSRAKDPFVAMQDAIARVAGKSSWKDVTSEDVLGWKNRLIERGYDGIILRKTIMDGAAGATARTIADPYHDFYIAFRPNQIKSAIGNIGSFTPTSNDIRYSLALGAIEPSTAIVPDQGGNMSGALGNLPTQFGGKPIRLLVGRHNAYEDKGYGANHILYRVMSNPSRMPEGAEETLEKIARTAQKTAQNYNRIYRDRGDLILYDGKNSLILSQQPDQASITTMYVQDNPDAKYGRPVWTGKAPLMPEFSEPLRGTPVIERDGRVGAKVLPTISHKRVVTPSTVLEQSEKPRVKGTLGIKQKFSLRDTIDQGTADAIDRTTTVRRREGFADRIIGSVSEETIAKLRQRAINKYEAIERQSRKIGEKFGPKELYADTSAIAAALLSDRAAGVTASSFVNGVPVYQNGFTTVSDLDGTVEGLIPILKPIAEYNDPYMFQAFQFYAGTRRGKRLTAEGREKLFTPEDIRRGELLAKKYPEFKQVFDNYQKYNEGLVNFLRDTGVISAKEAEVWTQNWDYIPFYRQLDGERTAGPNIFGSLAGVPKPKKLKGGEAPLADFMETVVRNARAAIEMGMKNVAAQRVMRDMLRLDQGREVPKGTSGLDVVTVKENGDTKYYQVDDPLLVESLQGLNLPQLPFIELLAKPAQLLRTMVTKDPGFMIANLIRDSLQAYAVSGTNMIPIVDTFKQYAQTLANASPEAAALAKMGLFTGYDFAGDIRSTTEQVEKELRRRTGKTTALEKAAWPITKMWSALDRGSTASDVATRAEVFKRVLKETGNEAEAAFQALEIMNFSRKGNSALIRILTAAIPFLNARIQGLDVLYRAGFGKMATQSRARQQKAFITRGLTLMALSMMYWMLASDTEEYKTATPEVRDNYWIIGNVRIPIPFELGTIFKVIPERILEYYFGMDTGQDLKNAAVRNITSTLAFNPIPQAVLPVFENIANYSFFTGQPIVGRGMEKIDPRFQASPGTSLVAQEIGSKTGYSPLHIDNIIRGYTGTLGTYALMALDEIIRNESHPTKATLKIEQYPVIKRFFASPEGSGTIDAYYGLKKQVETAVGTIKFLESEGRVDDLLDYLDRGGAELYSLEGYISSLNDQMTNLRQMRQQVLRSRIDPDQKRDILDTIRSAEVAITSNIQYVKKKVLK